MKRCFEYVDPPRHNKFWTVEAFDAVVYVTFGRIGSDGATQVKTFSTSNEASNYIAKMVREKTVKGYREVNSFAHPGSTAMALAQMGGVLLGGVLSPPPPPPPPAPSRGRRQRVSTSPSVPEPPAEELRRIDI